jgi:DNA-binding response OmpR family regulator
MPPRILIVEDDREISRMLRTTLELLDSNFKVVELPSAEEALLEAQRATFDLAIVDVRLPGMNGLELMRRVRVSRPEAQAIVVTGNPTPEAEREARLLNPVGFFVKPLNIDELTAVVLNALGRSQQNFSDQLPPPPSLAERLTALRRDLGCLAVYLGHMDGRVIARAGDVASFDVEGMLRYMEVAFSASLKVCSMLGGLVSQNLHFFDGDEFDVYMCNVGRFYMLVMLFDGEKGATAMGPVTRYGRQCADDMMNELAGMAAAADIPLERMIAPAPAPVEMPAAAVKELRPDALDAAAGQHTQQDLDSFWQDAAAQIEGGEGQANALSFEQAVKLGLVPKKNE